MTTVQRVTRFFKCNHPRTSVPKHA
jgi:hypothetical protein